MMSIWWNGEAVLQKFEKAWSARYEQIMPQCWKKCNTHVKIKKCPHSRTLAPFYEHNMSISPTKVKEKWTNKALKMPWGPMYAAIVPLWRSNKGNLMGHHAGIKAAINLRVNFTAVSIILLYIREKASCGPEMCSLWCVLWRSMACKSNIWGSFS